MATEIVQYKDEHIPLVEEFAVRMRQAGMPAEFGLPGGPKPAWLPKTSAGGPWNEHYLVMVSGIVRGVFVLKHEEFLIRGSRYSVACCHHAYSEGCIDKTFANIGVQIFRSCVAKHPLIYAMGMQGYDQPLPQMLIKMGWSHCLLPFHIKILNPNSFFNNVQIFRRNSVSRVVSTAARRTGLGSGAIRAAQSVLTLLHRSGEINYQIVDEFDDWADLVWKECEPCYTVLPVRTAEVLRILYPKTNHNFVRLRVCRGGEILGWAVVGHLQRSNDVNYGNAYMGTILDTLAKPQHASAVISAATQVLEGLGVDFIISNQSHAAWNRSLAESGFLRVPSNYIFATSRKMSQLLQPFDETLPSAHLNRSSGDGLFQYFFLGPNPLIALESRCSRESAGSLCAQVPQ